MEPSGSRSGYAPLSDAVGAVVQSLFVQPVMVHHRASFTFDRELLHRLEPRLALICRRGLDVRVEDARIVKAKESDRTVRQPRLKETAEVTLQALDRVIGQGQQSPASGMAMLLPGGQKRLGRIDPDEPGRNPEQPGIEITPLEQADPRCTGPDEIDETRVLRTIDDGVPGGIHAQAPGSIRGRRSDRGLRALLAEGLAVAGCRDHRLDRFRRVPCRIHTKKRLITLQCHGIRQMKPQAFSDLIGRYLEAAAARAALANQPQAINCATQTAPVM